MRENGYEISGTRWRYGKMKGCSEMGRDGWFNGYGKWVHAWEGMKYRYGDAMHAWGFMYMRNNWNEMKVG